MDQAKHPIGMDKTDKEEEVCFGLLTYEVFLGDLGSSASRFSH
jgi:hypothetical protein